MTAPLFPVVPQAAAGDVTAGEPPSDRGGAVTAGPADVQTHPPGFATSADRNGLCECGCGYTAQRGNRFIRGHQGRKGNLNLNRQYDDADGRAIAYYTGAADARNGRPHQGNPGDLIYTRGYNDQVAGNRQ